MAADGDPDVEEGPTQSGVDGGHLQDRGLPGCSLGLVEERREEIINPGRDGRCRERKLGERSRVFPDLLIFENS